MMGVMAVTVVTVILFRMVEFVLVQLHTDDNDVTPPGAPGKAGDAVGGESVDPLMLDTAVHMMVLCNFMGMSAG